MQNAAGPSFLSDCPTRLTVEIISDKWSALVLYGLSRKPQRHGELVQSIGGVSRKVLTQTLRRLEGYGLIQRTEETPRHSVYRLTELGQTLIEPIETLNAWALTHGAAVLEFQEPPSPKQGLVCSARTAVGVMTA